MKKAEAQKILGFVDEHMTTHPKDMDRFLDLFLDFINSITTDTDPRIEMLDELEDFASEYLNSVNYDEALRQISVDRIQPEDLITFIDELRDKIKQEAGDEKSGS
ncbi:hypothetical protein [Rhodobacteraceae phage LS06-2018-MD07]|nr:hypothetical protein [Rhodobacteraceae phage LS06-2018-MD07]